VQHYIQISSLFTFQTEFIDLAMKLSDGQTINSSIPAQKEATAPVNSEKVGKTVNADALQQLSNTWGKVTSSQPLSPEQVQRAVSQANNGSRPASTDSVLSDQIKLLEGQLKDGTKTMADLKLFLVKLDTQQGLLSLLSQNNLPNGNQVLINQNAQGVWQLQSPTQGFSLNNLTSQFSGNALTPPPIDLTSLAQALKSATLTTDSNILTKPPLTTIQSGAVITAQTAQSAILNSGQSLESSLLKLAEAAVQVIKKSGVTANSNLNVNDSSKTANGIKMDGLKLDGLKLESVSMPDFKARFKQVEQQVSQWVRQLTNEKPPLKSVDFNATQVANLANSTTQAAVLTTRPQVEKAVENISSLVQTKPAASTTLASSDNKSWLIKNQQQLLTEFTKNLTVNNSFIPNWSSSGQFKTSGELSELFNLLLTPKMNPSEGGHSIWPSNLSVQSQLQQTLQTLITHTPDAEKDTAQSLLLRQILNLSQGLMKVQHDQIHNRLGQQLDFSSPVQMSLPYIHQNQVQWADMEFKQSVYEDEKKEKTTGWHLILRFAQETPQSFSVETQLKQNNLSVVLWAEEKEQLKNLNTDISLLKEKLNHAGFNIESISSKHGSPVRIQKPIQQSLVDVHT
jgi:hypothetical protein